MNENEYLFAWLLIGALVFVGFELMLEIREWVWYHRHRNTIKQIREAGRQEK